MPFGTGCSPSASPWGRTVPTAAARAAGRAAGHSASGAYRQVTGDMRPPVSSGGATYAREFPTAVAFGMLFPGEEITFHRENECWSEKSLRTGFDILTEAIRAVCRVYGA